jgi:hypothetical protein
MADIEFVMSQGIYADSEEEIEFVTSMGIIQERDTPAGGYVPYPNPRYSLQGGMQPLAGGISC